MVKHPTRTAQRPQETKLVRRGVVSQPTRNEKPLYVMLDEADLARYKLLADDLGLSMRDFVRSALSAAWDAHQRAMRTAGHLEEATVTATATTSPGPPGADVASLHRRVLAQEERLGRLEMAVRKLDDGARTIDIVFSGPPGPEGGEFVEVEDERGHSIKIGEWIDRGDGFWALRIPRS